MLALTPHLGSEGSFVHHLLTKLHTGGKQKKKGNQEKLLGQLEQASSSGHSDPFNKQKMEGKVCFSHQFSLLCRTVFVTHGQAYLCFSSLMDSCVRLFLPVPSLVSLASSTCLPVFDLFSGLWLRSTGGKHSSQAPDSCSCCLCFDVKGRVWVVCGSVLV